MNENLIEENADNVAANQSAGEQNSPAESARQTANDAPAAQTAITALPTATIKIEGQEFALETAIAADDNLLRTALSSHYPSIKNANITRETGADGRTIVQIVKRAEHKGYRKQ